MCRRLTYFREVKKLILLFVACLSCENKPGEKPHAEPLPEQKVKEQFVRANQMLTRQEDEQIDQYARRHKLPLVKTSSGIRYFVYKPSATGDSVVPDMLVSMDYTLSLLDGTVCYTSDSAGRRSFIVGRDDIESGLHRGVQYLKRGDKAVLVIPSALAHGLLGDLNRIPPQMPIVYHLKLY
jgi:FKBP-type peptidyl-prolyl cis-trans isomerase FkpA